MCLMNEEILRELREIETPDFLSKYDSSAGIADEEKLRRLIAYKRVALHQTGCWDQDLVKLQRIRHLRLKFKELDRDEMIVQR